MRIAIGFLLVFFLSIVIGCGGDDAVDPGDNTPDPETPEMSIESFARAYALMDSTAYASYLDEEYTFELLPEEIDPNDPQGRWDRNEELDIAGNMFHGRFNSRGQQVVRIVLALDVKQSVVDNNTYPGKPAGETWYWTTCFVDLVVTADDPNDPEGIINYVVLSNQVFIQRPDPSGAERYIMYKQIDQRPINKTRASAAERVEGMTWGAVKSLFRS
ncbi:MAG: hypothetical protein FJY73_05290 [Candidatus Eisenbacteria bacterium]|nr:hypothetical protein [Candidatus Eisenbacteria bacterium]